MYTAGSEVEEPPSKKLKVQIPTDHVSENYSGCMK